MESGSGAGDRPCFVHVGTHKTATTAIQRFLAAHQAELAAGGTYYPRAGRYSDALPGHHNIPHQLYGDDRFDAALGTLSDLAAEIAACNAPRVCVSSEDFEYLHTHPAQLVAFRDAIAGAGYRPVVVLYLRAQSAYLESLYPTYAFHGGWLSFERYVADVMNDGFFLFRDDVGMRFEYTRLIEPFAAVFGRDGVIIRPYSETGEAAAVVRDFVELVDPVEHPAAFYASAVYENNRPAVGDVIRRLFANTAAELRCAEPLELVRRLAGGAESALPFAALPAEQRATVAARFRYDNALLGAQWDLSLASAERSQPDAWSAGPAMRLFVRAEAARAAFIAERRAPGVATG